MVGYLPGAILRTPDGANNVDSRKAIFDGCSSVREDIRKEIFFFRALLKEGFGGGMRGGP